MKRLLRAGLVGTALALPLASHAAVYATVVSATPVRVSVDVPQRVCTEEQRLVQSRPSGAGALIGAIAGGVLGNNVGHGFGRAAATGIGAVAGAAIGNSVETRGNPSAVVPVQRCRTVAGYETRTIGYDVVYEYAGQRYATRMASDPGARLAIDVRPSGAGPIERYDAAPDAEDPPFDDEAQPLYDAPEPIAYAPQPIYYRAAPAYYMRPPAVIVGPAIGIGFGFGGGHGYRGHGGHGDHPRWR